MVDTATATTTEAVLIFSEELTRIACSGGGIKALATHLAQHIEAAVLVEDAEWRHLALSGATGRTVPASARDLLGKGHTTASGAMHFSLPGNREGIAFPIRAGDSLLGRLSIFPDQTLRETDSAFARLAATSLAIELSREQGGNKNRRKSFWDRLLARAYEDPIEAKDDATSRGITLASGYVAVAIEAEGLDENSATSKHADLRRICLEALRSSSAEIVVVERGSGFVFLCPAPLEVDVANTRTAAGLIPRIASKTLVGAKLVGGVGRYADAIDAARTVEEAREAMFITRRLFGIGRVITHEELGIYPFILRGASSREDWHRLSEHILEKLRSYDAKHQTELIRTLALYFTVGQNVKTAAAELNVHRHTVFYRLRQIAEISGLNLDSPHDQLTLRAAIAIDTLYA